MEFKLPQRKEISNKSTYGRVLNIAGSDYMSGAAYLSSTAALKIGCGYCFLSASDEARRAIAAQTQNIVFVKPRDLKSQLRNADVVSFGCGLGQDKFAKAQFKNFFKYTPKDTPVVIDADGLNLISKNQCEYIKKDFQYVVFTPHPLEAARLLNVDDISFDIEWAAKEITENYNCVTVLKTHKTFVCAPDGRTYTNNTGNNALAKAGSGDVLTGIISGLAAQGMELFEAACLGVYLHGLCGDIAAQKLSPYCVMAEDLINTIPEAVKTLLT